LEKDMEQRYSKTSKASSDDGSDDEIDNQSEDIQTDNSDQDDVVVEAAPVAITGKRKGRRAVSTGVISTN
jgi:hypothetical protein